MAFILVKRALAAVPVTANIYNEQGEPTEVSFVAQYERHTQTQVVDLQDAMTNRVRASRGEELIVREDGGEVPAWSYSSDSSFIKEKLKGWVGVEDSAGVPVPFTAKALDRLITDYPELVIPLFGGFFAAHQGVRQKN